MTDFRVPLVEGDNRIEVVPEYFFEIGLSGDNVVSFIASSIEDTRQYLQQYFYCTDATIDNACRVARLSFSDIIDPTCFYVGGFEPTARMESFGCNNIEVQAHSAVTLSCTTGITLVCYRRDPATGVRFRNDVIVTIGLEDGITPVAIVRKFSDLNQHFESEGFLLSDIVGPSCGGCPDCAGGFLNGRTRVRRIPDASCPVTHQRDITEQCTCGVIEQISSVCVPPPAGCIDGATQIVPDASCPSGSRNQTCVGGVWVNGTCVPPPCPGCGGGFDDGETRNRTVADASCPSGSTTITERCECNRVVEVSRVCVPPPPCSPDGADRIIPDASCESGQRNQTCEAGRWKNTTCVPKGDNPPQIILPLIGGIALGGLIVFLISKTRKKRGE